MNESRWINQTKRKHSNAFREQNNSFELVRVWKRIIFIILISHKKYLSTPQCNLKLLNFLKTFINHQLPEGWFLLKHTQILFTRVSPLACSSLRHEPSYELQSPPPPPRGPLFVNKRTHASKLASIFSPFPPLIHLFEAFTFGNIKLKSCRKRITQENVSRKRKRKNPRSKPA